MFLGVVPQSWTVVGPILTVRVEPGILLAGGDSVNRIPHPTRHCLRARRNFQNKFNGICVLRGSLCAYTGPRHIHFNSLSVFTF